MASRPEAPQQSSLASLLNSTSAGLMRTPSGLGTKSAVTISRQSSIYSVTIDEFQNALGEPTRSLGSMNMDEFLKNIWTAEESQAMAAAMGVSEDPGGILGRQHSLQRQGSFSLSGTLSRRTVDDVWKDITRVNMEPSGGQERQATFGEMTLEDFLVKAGVVREADTGIQSLVPFGLGLEGDFVSFTDQKNDERNPHGNILRVNLSGKVGDEEKPGVKMLPTLSLSPANVSAGQTGLDSVQLDPVRHPAPSSQQTEWLSINHFRAANVHQHQRQNILQQHAYANAANRAGNGAVVESVLGCMGMLGEGGVVGSDLGVGLSGALGGGMATTSLGLKTGTPPSPGSDKVGLSHDVISTLSPLPYGIDCNLRGRKRGLEGSLENVVQRRQRRMIKNRESADRSRARKQAYTVELEAEVTQLKEENVRLCRQEAAMAEQWKKQILDMMASFARHFATKTRVLRRTHTGPCMHNNFHSRSVHNVRNSDLLS